MTHQNLAEIEIGGGGLKVIKNAKLMLFGHWTTTDNGQPVVVLHVARARGAYLL
jgi:hypothetical protein